MEKPNDMDRALELGDILTTTDQRQRDIEIARTVLKSFTNPYAVDFLNAVIAEGSRYIAG